MIWPIGTIRLVILSLLYSPRTSTDAVDDHPGWMIRVRLSVRQKRETTPICNTSGYSQFPVATGTCGRSAPEASLGGP